LSTIFSRVRELARSDRRDEPRTADESQREFVCHCKHVEYKTVERAIRKGARSISDLQRQTEACTRCFGCRHELERLLDARLGDRYERQSTITLPPELRRVVAPRPMYMPVFAGFDGREIDTRVIVFNWDGPPQPVPFRLDLLRMDGERVRVWDLSVASGCSTVVDLDRNEVGEVLPEGVGVVKLVLESEEVGSLRPYFQFVTPTSITSTHEKKGPVDIHRQKDRNYHWIFPIGSCSSAEDAYFFCTNTQMTPMEGQRLVWQNDAGESAETPFPTLGFSQSACVPLHEAFPALREGRECGAVRLDPATHTVAGFMIRHDPERELWRVQHL
jgi:bacterioferritin-associated ferredoxin